MRPCCERDVRAPGRRIAICVGPWGRCMWEHTCYKLISLDCICGTRTLLCEAILVVAVRGALRQDSQSSVHVAPVN